MIDIVIGKGVHSYKPSFLLESLTKAAVKGLAGVLLAAVIQFLKREKRAEAKNKQDPSATSTGASEESTGLTAVTLRQPYITPLHCCIVLQSESERNTSCAASAGTAAWQT